MKAKVGLLFPRFRYPSGDAPLGVACLAAWLRERLPVHVSVCDTTFAPSLATIRRFLLRERPDILGIGLSTLMLGEASAAARLAHALGIPVFLGGPHATVDPRGVMAWEGVDAVVIGEGELSAEDLVRMFLESGGRPDRRHEVPGCLVRGTGGRLLQAAAREPMADLDALPFPAWDLLDMETYLSAWGQLDGVRPGLRGVNLMAGRGCAHTCAFCQPMVARLFGARPRFRSPEHVLREIRDLDLRFRIDGFWFTDDTFASDAAWLERFCQGLERFGRSFVWGCNTRAGLLSRDVLARMAGVGLRRLGVGLESASDRIREGIYRKGVTLEDAARTARDAAEFGIATLAFAMLGAPGETRREMLQTIESVTSMAFREASFSLFVPIPGTAIYDDMKKRGVPLSENYTDYDYYARQPFPNEIGPVQLRALQRWAYLRFYSHPRRLGSVGGALLEPAGRRSLGRKVRRILPRGVAGPIDEHEVVAEIRRMVR
jgi:anaerobic magnesium-protoporphyrin IX monomethyl ester cyclase